MSVCPRRSAALSTSPWSRSSWPRAPMGSTWAKVDHHGTRHSGYFRDRRGSRRVPIRPPLVGQKDDRGLDSRAVPKDQVFYDSFTSPIFD